VKGHWESFFGLIVNLTVKFLADFLVTLTLAGAFTLTPPLAWSTGSRKVGVIVYDLVDDPVLISRMATR
jgi:hypothetical protein